MQTLETRLEQLERGLAEARRELAQARRRARVFGGLALFVVLSAIGLSAMPSAKAQGQGEENGLAHRMTIVETKVATLQTVVNNHTTWIGALQTQVNSQGNQTASLEDLLIHFSRNGNDVFITGANLHIVNGQGSTETTNGVGNLIVGYNELRGGGNDRSGSHNIVAGRENNFSRFGGLVVGYRNEISGNFSSVSGGEFNTASAQFASVSGGAGNTANGDASSVSGGAGNITTGDISSVSGGVNVGQITAYGWSAGAYGNPVSGRFSSP